MPLPIWLYYKLTTMCDQQLLHKCFHLQNTVHDIPVHLAIGYFWVVLQDFGSQILVHSPLPFKLKDRHRLRKLRPSPYPLPLQCHTIDSGLATSLASFLSNVSPIGCSSSTLKNSPSGTKLISSSACIVDQKTGGTCEKATPFPPLLKDYLIEPMRSNYSNVKDHEWFLTRYVNIVS